jgi:5-methyltetrahydrofolate--homocysteine methyltransferase
MENVGMYIEYIRNEIVAAVIDLNEGRVEELIKKGIDEQIDLTMVINDGLTVGLRKLGDLFQTGKAFLPELMKGVTIVHQSLEKLKPHMGKDVICGKAKLLIGTVAGDIHDLGKNIVSSVFSAACFEVVDLGVNVSTELFVEKVKEEHPELLGLSALLTTTMVNQRKVIEALTKAGLRDNVKIIIGGAPVSGSWAKMINADGFAEDAFSAIKKAEQLLKSNQNRI